MSITPLISAWKKTKNFTVNLYSSVKRTKDTIEEVDDIALDIALSMKRTLDKSDLLEIAKDLEARAKLLRKIANSL
jgi:hypothetical protein